MTLFRLPAFRRLWTSSLAASGAQGMERTATAWVALETGGDPLAIGLIFAARMLPSLLFGLASGTVADRADRPRLLLAVAGAAAVLVALFGWLIGIGKIQTWQVIAFSFMAGCLHVFDIPARQALVLDAVPRESAMQALALNALAGRFSAALGALAGGALILFIGVARCYFVIAIIYSLGAALVVALPVPQVRRGLARPSFWRALGGAARLIVDVPVVRTLISAGLVCEVFAFSHMSALPLFSQDVLAVGAEGLGTLNAATAIGGAIAVVLLALLPVRIPRQPLLFRVWPGDPGIGAHPQPGGGGGGAGCNGVLRGGVRRASANADPDGGARRAAGPGGWSVGVGHRFGTGRAPGDGPADRGAWGASGAVDQRRADGGCRSGAAAALAGIPLGAAVAGPHPCPSPGAAGEGFLYAVFSYCRRCMCLGSGCGTCPGGRSAGAAAGNLAASGRATGAAPAGLRRACPSEGER